MTYLRIKNPGIILNGLTETQTRQRSETSSRRLLLRYRLHRPVCVVNPCSGHWTPKTEAARSRKFRNHAQDNTHTWLHKPSAGPSRPQREYEATCRGSASDGRGSVRGREERRLHDYEREAVRCPPRALCWGPGFNCCRPREPTGWLCPSPSNERTPALQLRVNRAEEAFSTRGPPTPFLWPAYNFIHRCAPV
jgi:hypothetical protein